MKQKLFFVILCLLAFLGVQAQLSTNPDKFLGNITTDYNVDFGSAEKFYLLWNQITPENETKWDAIEGSKRGTFTFGNADRSANYAKQHNFPFKYHTLIWGAQYPGWVNDLSTAEQYQAIVEYFDAVKEHYPNLEIIDVVNEAVAGHQPAPYRAALGGEGRTGYDWIIKAFQLAHERWPNAILVYNDFNTFQWQRSEFINLVRTMRDAGAPIDAYGCQSHDVTDMSLSDFKSAMNEIQTALKMPMYSTEFDIGTNDDQKQLTQYKNLVPVMWEADYCAGITLWGWIYGHTWTGNEQNGTKGNSGLIREKTVDGKKVYEDRPAMTWLREYMASDKAKQAKSPFPGFKKEFSVYVKPASTKVAKGDVMPVWVDATAATKTIEKVELYNGSELLGTKTEAPYLFDFTSATTGTKTLKAVVTATDGTTWERLSRVQVLSATTARTPYNDVVPELPGELNAMEYDNGAAGVAYSNATRNGATKTGGWMEYTVDVKEAGLYSVDIEVTTSQADGMFHLVDNHFGNMIFLSDFVTVPNTRGENKTFHTRLTTPLEEGRRTLCLCIDKGGFSIGKMTFTRLETYSAIRTSVNVNPATINVGEATTIKATAAVGSSTSIANVRIFVDDMLLTTLTEKPYETQFVPTVKGTYTISTIATDAQGRESLRIQKTTLTVNGEDPATPDPNFYVYLCFGQSNMEGNATPEAVDQTVDSRFKMLACVNFTSPQRTMGKWYTATPPIVRQGTGLGMADYFGRTMVANLPEEVSVGVVDVAIGGTKIEGFMQDQVASYIASMDPSSEGWLINYFKAYDNDPYQRLVDMAKIAQKSGVIKGILLHQGESNNGQADWPQKVKTIYNNLLVDLGLNAADVPLFVGETVSQAEGGACWAHNNVIATVPNVIPNSYVISSANCPQKGDGLHFTVEGYRIMGARYAQKALDVMNNPDAYTKYFSIDERLTGTLSNLAGKTFAIVNEEESKALYCPLGQQLGYESYRQAFNMFNAAFLFKTSRVGSGRGLRLVTPQGDEYTVDGNTAYLNSQAVTGDCCFINGLGNQRGYDIQDGAQWTLEYVDGKGWSMKNVGTGKYLKDASHPAMFDEPTYFTFCTLKEGTDGIREVYDAPSGALKANDLVYNLQGVKVGTKSDWNTLPKGIYIVGGRLTVKK